MTIEKANPIKTILQCLFFIIADDSSPNGINKYTFIQYSRKTVRILMPRKIKENGTKSISDTVCLERSRTVIYTINSTIIIVATVLTIFILRS